MPNMLSWISELSHFVRRHALDLGDSACLAAAALGICRAANFESIS